MGFAMENFDAVGKWRTEDNGFPIDASSVTTTGKHLDGVESLREFTLENGDEFARVVLEKLLTYAIGRGLEYEDMPMLRALADDAAEHDYRFSALLLGVVESPAFTMNMTATENLSAAETVTTAMNTTNAGPNAAIEE
jgi:hypothetical protein